MRDLKLNKDFNTKPLPSYTSFTDIKPLENKVEKESFNYSALGKTLLVLGGLALIAGCASADKDISLDSTPVKTFKAPKLPFQPEVKENTDNQYQPKIKKSQTKKKTKPVKTVPKIVPDYVLDNQKNINSILEQSLNKRDRVINYNIENKKHDQARIEIFAYDGNNVSKYHGKVRLNKDGKVKLRENKKLNLVKNLKKQTFDTKDTFPNEILNIESKNKVKANQALDSLLDKAVKELKHFAGKKEFTKKQARLFSGMIHAAKDSELIDVKDEILLTNGLINKKLDCDLWSLIYKGVEERLGLPEGTVNIVKAPGHAFIRFKLDDNNYVNIETLTNKIVDDDYYKRIFKIHENSIKKGVFLKNMTKNEIKGLVYNNLGLDLIKKRQFDKALMSLNKSVELNPKLPEAFNHKGLCLYNLNSLDDALNCFDKVIELDHYNSAAFNNKGNIYFCKRKFDKAVDCYDNAIKLNPKSVNTYVNKGIALGKLDKLDKALESYDKAIALNPKSGFAYMQKGITLHQHNKLEKAIAAYNKALQFYDRTNPKYNTIVRNRDMARNSLNR